MLKCFRTNLLFVFKINFLIGPLLSFDLFIKKFANLATGSFERPRKNKKSTYNPNHVYKFSNSSLKNQKLHQTPLDSCPNDPIRQFSYKQRLKHRPVHTRGSKTPASWSTRPAKHVLAVCPACRLFVAPRQLQAHPDPHTVRISG